MPVAPLRTPSDRSPASLRSVVELAGGDWRPPRPGSRAAPAGEHRAEPGIGLACRAPRHARALRARGRRRPSRGPRRRPFRAAPRPRSARRARPSPPPASTQDHVLPLGEHRAADEEDVALAGARCAAHATSTALTPALSSPMKVRDEPVTLWTMEMLPATRLGSCARKSVGRRSLDSRSLRNSAGAPEPCRRLRGWSGRPSGRVRRPRPRPPCWCWRGCRCCRLIPASSSARPAV